ncbi:podocalyxin [Poecilia latipinna]|uniref:Podocalyxin n=1 Tax=Poecilia latipinna TaxID=48699 RepID=A0A3B3U4S6_9TELE|nr:PREDICTED: podocalyxin [Poecilia latipinna]
MRATLTVTWLLLSLSICSESSGVSTTKPDETGKPTSASTVTSASIIAPGSPQSSHESKKPTSEAPSIGTTQQQPTTVTNNLPTVAAANTTTAQSKTNTQILTTPATTSGAINPPTTTVTTSITTVISTSTTNQAIGSPDSNSNSVLTTATVSNRGTVASTLKPSENAMEKTTNTAGPPVGPTSQRSQATLTAASSNEGSKAGPTPQTVTKTGLESTAPSNSNQVPERSSTSSHTPTAKDTLVITQSPTPAAMTWPGVTETNTETFLFSLSDSESTKNKTLVQLCKSFMSSLRNSTCIATLQNNGSKIGSLMIEVDINLVQEQLSKLKEEKKPAEEPTDNKTLTAILASCGALLIMIIILGVCVSQRRKPYNENQLHLTEELHTVENGYHDNPTLEVMEVQPEMQEKKMALNGEFSDSWIVPIDNLMKEDAPDEEDTHL